MQLFQLGDLKLLTNPTGWGGKAALAKSSDVVPIWNGMLRLRTPSREEQDVPTTEELGHSPWVRIACAMVKIFCKQGSYGRSGTSATVRQ